MGRTRKYKRYSPEFKREALKRLSTAKYLRTKLADNFRVRSVFSVCEIGKTHYDQWHSSY